MSPSVCGVADARVVIEENTDRSVGELEAEPVLVAVVDPLGDEERPLLDEAEAGLWPGLAGHHTQRVEDGVIQTRGPGLQLGLLVDTDMVLGAIVNKIAVGPIMTLLLLVRQTEAEDGWGQVGDLRVWELGGGRLSAARRGQGQRIVAWVEEGLGRDGRHLGPVGGRGVEQEPDQGRGGGRHRVRDWEHVIRDPRVRLLQCRGLEGRLAHQQGVHDAAQRPDIGGEAVTLLVQNLGGNVVGRPANCPENEHFLRIFPWSCHDLEDTALGKITHSLKDLQTYPFFSCPNRVARPKSPILTDMLAVRKRFPSLRSLWMMFWLCMYSTPWHRAAM